MTCHEENTNPIILPLRVKSDKWANQTVNFPETSLQERHRSQQLNENQYEIIRPIIPFRYVAIIDKVQQFSRKGIVKLTNILSILQPFGRLRT